MLYGMPSFAWFDGKHLDLLWCHGRGCQVDADIVAATLLARRLGAGMQLPAERVRSSDLVARRTEQVLTCNRQFWSM